MYLIRQLRTVISTLYAQGGLYRQLMLMEWSEEKNRLWKLLIVMVLGLCFVFSSLILIGALVLILTWETQYRHLAVISLLVTYTTGAVVCCYRVKILVARSMLAFADTRKEIAADIALIKSKLTQ